MTALMLKMQNSQNLRFNANAANTNNRQTQIQSRPCLVTATGVTAPDPSAWERNHSGDGRLLSTGLSEEYLEWRTNFQDPMFRAKHWLNGIAGREGFEEPFGAQVFTHLLHERGIELPENARFNISVDRYGAVTITGLDNEELTRELTEAMSYDSQMVISVLAQFMEYGRILEGHPPNSTGGLSGEQQTLIAIQSALMNHGVGLHDLRLVDGIIQGLPQELYDLLYGDRIFHLEGLNENQIKQENSRLNWLRDNTANFLRNGTAHIPDPNISLTFDNGRIIVNGVSAFNPNNGGGFNVTI